MLNVGFAGPQMRGVIKQAAEGGTRGKIGRVGKGGGGVGREMEEEKCEKRNKTQGSRNYA